jgi:hypothetical protein
MYKCLALYPDPRKVSPFSFDFHFEKSRTPGPAYKAEKSTGIIGGCSNVYPS